MKFSEKSNVIVNGELYNSWVAAANKLTIEYGIFVETWHVTNKTKVKELYYKIGDHRFECLKDVRKAIRLKSFL